MHAVHGSWSDLQFSTIPAVLQNSAAFTAFSFAVATPTSTREDLVSEIGGSAAVARTPVGEAVL